MDKKEVHVLMIFCEDFDEAMKVRLAVGKGLRLKRMPLYKFAPVSYHVCHGCESVIQTNYTRDGEMDIILCPSCGSHILRP